MNVKITAMEALKDKRSDWGIQRKWRGDYLNISSENLDPEAYRTSLAKEGVSPATVVFSTKVAKFNRHGKVNERALVITQDRLLKMDPLKKFKVMLNVPLGEVRNISLSPDPGNQLIVIGFSPVSGHNDLIMSLVSAKGDDLVGEAVGVISSRHARLSVDDPLLVKVSNILQFQSGKKIQSITINARAVTDNNNPSGGGNLGPSSLTQNQFIRSKGGGVVYTAITATAN